MSIKAHMRARQAVSRLIRFAPHIALLSNLIVLGGCSTEYVMKGAERLQPEERAVLTDKFPPLKPWVFVTAVDGVSRGYGLYTSYYLAPGRRKIEVRGNSQLYLYDDIVTLSFDAAPGGKYELKFEPLREKGSWRAWIEDEQTGTVVSD